MYENFFTIIEKQINKNLYYNEDYFIEKTIITTWLYHPTYRKLFELKFHIAEIKEANILDKTIENANIFPWWTTFINLEFLRFINKITILDEDLNEELKLYWTGPQQKTYMFMEVYYKGKLQPPYFAFTFFSRFTFDYNDISINKHNFPTFKKSIKLNLEKFLECGIISPSTFCEFFKITEKFGDIVNSYLFQNNLLFKYFNFKQELNEITKYINIEQNSRLRHYLYIPYRVFLKLLIHENRFSTCEYCNQVIDYRKDKKYCSLVSENSDCGKKARNERDYLKRKKKKQKKVTSKRKTK